jgi:hypothetical protein
MYISRSSVWSAVALVLLTACASGRSGLGTPPEGQLGLTPVVPAASGPKITKVSRIRPEQTQTIVITGRGFGTSQPYSGDGNGDLVFYITGSLGDWAAGCGPHESENCTVGLAVKSWTDTKITVSGFTGQYGYGYFVLNTGYKVQVDVYNPQTQKGPAKSKSIRVH